MIRASHGWRHLDRQRKREIIESICAGTAPAGPSHIELDLTDRCNIACYFCNQQDLRTREQIPLDSLTSMIDELASTGLRSVRLSGGGDPLFHRDIDAVLDHLALRGVVVDNLTTNGVALTAEIAEHLVRNEAREVIISLNAPDAAHYHRMMRVKPALFDRVIENAHRLVGIRGDCQAPSIVVQFLLDRENLDRLVDMYELGHSIGADRIAISVVLEVPQHRIEHDILVRGSDAARLEPLLKEIIRRDRDRQSLQMDFAIPEFNAVVRRLRAELDAPPLTPFETASSFQDRNSGCFFAWYTATVTGNGDVRPCCLMLSPSNPPLGNIHEQSLSEQWTGERFSLMRSEMRSVLLMNSHIDHETEHFEILPPQCTEAHRCWMKNIFFREDEAFYAELAQALDQTRADEARWFGSPRQMHLKFRELSHRHPGFHSILDRLRNGSRPLRIWIKENLGLDATNAI